MILSSSLFTFIFIKAEGGWKGGERRKGRERERKGRTEKKKTIKLFSLLKVIRWLWHRTHKENNSELLKRRKLRKKWGQSDPGMLGVRYVCLSPARVCHTYLASIPNLLCLPAKLQHIYRSVFTSVASLWTPTPAFNIMVPFLFGISTSSILFTKRKVAGSVRSNRKSFWSSTNISLNSFNLSL